MNKRIENVCLGVLYFSFLSLIIHIFHYPELLNLNALESGELVGSFLGAIIFFLVIGGIAYFLTGKSIKDLYITATIFFLLIFIGMFDKEDEELEQTKETGIYSKIEQEINTNGIDQFMEKYVVEEQQQFPIKKDRLETIVTVYYIKKTRAKTYKIVLDPDWRKIISTQVQIPEKDIEKYIIDIMSKLSINSQCSNDFHKILLSHGVTIVTVYTEQDGTTLFTIRVSQKDC